MAQAAHRSHQPLKTLINHGHFNIIVLHVLEQSLMSWSQFIRLSKEELAELIPEVVETLAQREGLRKLAEVDKTIVEG